jgi:hypothetical protein
MPRKKRHRKQARSGAGLKSVIVGLLLVSIVLVAAVVLGLGVYFSYSALQSRWLGIEPYRILVLEQDEQSLERVISIHVMPDKREVVVLETPLATKIPVAGGYGQYSIEALPRLGQIEGVGDKMLTKSMERLLGVQFQAVLYRQAPSELKNIDTSFVAGIANSLVAAKFSDAQSFYDAVVINRLLKTFANRKLQIVAFDQAGLLQQVDVVDGVTATVADELQLNRIIAKDIVASDPQLAAVSVVLENTTGHAGLAAYWGRYVAHAGYDVMRLVDASVPVEKTQLVFSTQALRNSSEGILLQRLFPENETLVASTQEYRSDVVIKLGEVAFAQVAGKEVFN